jgi:hypothetical protein
LTAASSLDFLSLRDLLNGQVHNLLALEAAKDAQAKQDDTRLAQPVAIIHDAWFDAEGNLQSLVVAAGKRGDGAGHVVLPVREVRWHPARKLLVTDLGASQIANLAAQDGTKKTPAEASARKTWLATELMAATARCSGEQGNVPDDGRGSIPTIWYMPASNRIGFAAVGKSPHLVPWSVIRPQAGGPPLVLEIQAPAERVAGAPAVADVAVPPDAAVRLQSYRHFATSLPAWDRPGDEAGKVK